MNIEITIKENNFMTMNDIMASIEMLAKSQGFYGRLYREICNLKMYEPEQYKKVKQELEQQHFTDAIDMIFYFEC